MEFRSCAEEAKETGHGHSCSDGHDHGGHGHGHGHGHDHSHEAEDPDGFSLYSYIDLEHCWCLKCASSPRVRSMPSSHRPLCSEAESRSVGNALKPPSQKLDRTRVLRSDDGDPELLVHVSFTTTVCIRSICVIGGPEGACPTKMKACVAGRARGVPQPAHPRSATRPAASFLNKDHLDFGAVEDMPPVQTWELVENLDGAVEYPTRCACAPARGCGARAPLTGPPPRHRYSRFQNVNAITLHFPDSFNEDTSVISYLGFKGEHLPSIRKAVACEYELQPVAGKNKVADEASGAKFVQ